MKTFTYASAFAGIGGMTLGLKDLGGIGVAAWEYDPTSKKTQYAHNAHKLLHPEIPLYGDICKAETKELPDFDVFCFTPPCQAFSIAGKRGGFDDTRGTLTFEALRIAKEKQPKILFMENVKGLVNHDKGNTMGTIIHAINEIGYVIDFTILNSKYFDVAQNRERVYLIGVREDLIKETPWIDIIGNTMLPKSKKRYQFEGAKTFNFDWPKQEEVRTRLKDFLESEVDEKFHLSNDKTEKLILELEKKGLNNIEKVSVEGSYQPDNSTSIGQRYQIWGVEGVSDALTATMYKQPQAIAYDGLAIKEATKKGYDIAQEGDSANIQFPKSKTRRGRIGKQIANTLEASNVNQGVVEKIKYTNVLGLLDINENEQIRRVYDINGQYPTLTTMQCGMQEPKIAEIIPVITPDRTEKRQNGRRFKEDGEESFTITTLDRHGVAIGNYPKYIIRKLTPTECLRLQSIPEWAIEKLKENFSDSRLYKFAGNGLTTNVITAIGKKIVELMEEIND